MPTAPASSEEAFLWAIGQQESGGRYSTVQRDSGALGKYQVMPANVAEWTKRALGHSLTPQQFLASPSAQEAVAHTILGGYYARYGAAGAAAMWYSGQPDPNKTYGNPPVYRYVASVLALMARAPGGGAAASVPPQTPDGTATGTGSDPNAVQTASKPANCLVGFNIKISYVCILTHGQARAIEGALLLIAGGIIGAAGLILLATTAVQKTGLASSIAQTAGAIPGAGSIASAATRASGKKTPARKRPAPEEKKTAEKKTPAKKTPAKKTPAKKTPATTEET